MSVRMIRWPHDHAALLDHIWRVYGPDDVEMVAAWYGTTPDFDPADCFVIDGNAPGEIAAHALILSRQIQIGEVVLPAAEITLLGVLEAYQDRGLEAELLDAVHDRMTERGDALGLGFGSLAPFEPWHYDYAAGLYLTAFESSIDTGMALSAGRWDSLNPYDRRTADRLGASNRHVEVRRFYASDLPAVQALYAAESARGHYLIARDEATWTWQLAHMNRIGRNEPDDFLVAEIDDRLVAYARLVTQAPVNWFREAGGAPFSVIEAAGDHPDAIQALLGTIARTAQAFAADRIGLFVHPQSAFMRHALARGAALRAFTGAGFLRLHDLPLALYLLEPTLEARLLNSRFVARAYHLVVSTEHDQAELMLGTGDPEVVEIEAPSTSLVRLVTGWYGIDHLAVGYHERHADLLRVLFPQRDPKIGLADLL
jgi:GNAT superfamily N-acetyltransferase